MFLTIWSLFQPPFTNNREELGGHVSHGFSSETLRGKLILAVKRVTLYVGTLKRGFVDFQRQFIFGALYFHQRYPIDILGYFCTFWDFHVRICAHICSIKQQTLGQWLFGQRPTHH